MKGGDYMCYGLAPHVVKLLPLAAVIAIVATILGVFKIIVLPFFH